MLCAPPGSKSAQLPAMNQVQSLKNNQYWAQDPYFYLSLYPIKKIIKKRKRKMNPHTSYNLKFEIRFVQIQPKSTNLPELSSLESRLDKFTQCNCWR